MKPLVSVIVLNYNGANFLDDCLGSLLEQSWAPLEVILADNGSSDASAKVTARYPVEWLPLGKNHGFAAGNVLGATHARGQFLVFVNTDMRFHRDFVRTLVEPLYRYPQLFATDARQRDWNDTQDVHSATWFVKRALLQPPFRARALPRYDFLQRPTDGPVRVSQACGGNIAVRRSMWDALGGFDARLPAGWEDTEICWRAWLMGWQTVHTPDALCWHHVGGSSTSIDGSMVRLRGTCIGRLLFSSKHLPCEDVLLAWLAEIAGTIRDLAFGRYNRGKVRLRLIRLCVRALPDWLAERRRLYGRKGTSTRMSVKRMTLIANQTGWLHGDERLLP